VTRPSDHPPLDRCLPGTRSSLGAASARLLGSAPLGRARRAPGADWCRSSPVPAPEHIGTTRVTWQVSAAAWAPPHVCAATLAARPSRLADPARARRLRFASLPFILWATPRRGSVRRFAPPEPAVAGSSSHQSRPASGSRRASRRWLGGSPEITPHRCGLSRPLLTTATAQAVVPRTIPRRRSPGSLPSQKGGERGGSREPTSVGFLALPAHPQSNVNHHTA
jgi:hypothetical protein